MVVCGSGYVYLFPGYVGPITSIEVATGQVTAGTSFSYPSGGTFDLPVNAIYSTSNGTDPNSIQRFDTSAGVLGTSTQQPSSYFGVFDVCGPLWISQDGSTIYSACGPVYRASTDSNQDMRYLGTLPFPSTSQSLSTSATLGQIAAIPTVEPYSIPATPNADTVVNLYSSSSFTAVGQFATTPFQVNSSSFAAHARRVFYNSTSTAMYIITQADPSAGLTLDYAVDNVNLTTANSCSATFGASSASATAPGGYQTVQITSGEDCVFTAVSNVPWIILTSGYYGSGNTTLTYLVRPNVSTTPRSGTITLGAETFTVSQDAAGAASSVNPLSYNPIAALYDKAMDKIVMVSSSPNELHIYDPVTYEDDIVPLSYTPLSLALRPDGLFAAVGHSGKISIVDLQGQTVSQTIPVDMDNGGIALASNGYAYAFPAQTNSWGSINSVQLSNGTLTTLQDTYYGNIPVLDSTGNYLYVGSLGEGSSKLNISNGPATYAYGGFQFSYNLWLSEDGNRLFLSDGQVLFASSVEAQDLQPDGELQPTNRLDWVADSRVQQQIAVLTDISSTSDTVLQLYESNGLQLQSQESMPGFTNNGTTYVSHGKYVFWNAAASKLFAITEADSTSGLLSNFAVNTVALPESLPTCTYAVSPTSISVPYAGGSWTFNVTSNCAWTPILPSNAWFFLASASLTNGTGQFIIEVDENTTTSPRTASLSVGSQTITINQAAGCVFSLSSSSATFSLAGGSGQVYLSTGPTCTWSVQSLNSWLTVTSSASGTGSATIEFSAAPAGFNATQYGNLIIGGSSLFTVIEEYSAPVTLSVNPTALNFGSATVLTRNNVQSITITNSTGQTMPTGTITISGPNAASFPFWTNCGATLAPNATCTVGVTFVPSLASSANAYLNIPIDTSGDHSTVLLLGSGQLTGGCEIVSAPTGKVLEVPGGSTADGTLVAQNSLNGSEQQQWKVVPTGDGYYYIQNILTGKVLDVIGGSTDNATLIQQYDYLNVANQQWQLVPVDDVHYKIINRKSGKVLDVVGGSTGNGSPIQQFQYAGDNQQLWVLQPIQSYAIGNTLSTYMLDVPNGSTADGTLLQQWSTTGSRQQQWQFLPVGGGYYAILNRNSGKVLDVIGGSKSNGTLIQQYDYVGGANQQWQIIPLDGTNYKIVNRLSGDVLDDMGSSTTAGTQIQQWQYNGTTNQQWQITPVVYYNIVNNKSGLVLDVIGGSTADGANIQQWSSNGSQQQQWTLLQVSGNYYSMVNNRSGKVLDVTGGSKADGTLIQQYDFLVVPNQEWQLTSVGNGFFEIQNVNSGKVLDMTGGSMSGGALLQQYDYLGGANQQWKFVPVSY